MKNAKEDIMNWAEGNEDVGNENNKKDGLDTNSDVNKDQVTKEKEI